MSRDAPSLGMEQETDVWWGAYSWRALLPVMVASVLLTALVIGCAWYLVSWRGIVQLRYGAHVLLVLFWLGQLGRWAYLMVGLNCRLTTRRLFLERGFRHPGRPGLSLAAIGQVVVSRRPFQSFCDVGQVLIFEAGAAQPTMVLEGIRGPEHIAMLIRKQVHDLRERQPPGN
jgi:hypothetical protein